MYSPHVLLVFVAAGVIYLMMAAGVQKRALEWKHRPRFCPACGRRPCRCASPGA
jgi:formate dehydrogenase maturation protein FdhE